MAHSISTSFANINALLSIFFIVQQSESSIYRYMYTVICQTLLYLINSNNHPIKKKKIKC